MKYNIKKEIRDFISEIRDVTDANFRNIAETAIKFWDSRGNLTESQVIWVVNNASIKNIPIPKSFIDHFNVYADVRNLEIEDCEDKNEKQNIEEAIEILENLIYDLTDILKVAVQKLEDLKNS